MNKLNNICFFLLLISITSCEKEIPSYFDNAERKIVMNSIIHPDSLITISLSESLYPNESFFYGTTGGYQSIDDAVVSLFEDGNYIGELKHNKLGRYVGEYYPQMNHQYTIKTTTDGYPNIQSVTGLPDKILLDSVKLINVSENVFYNLKMKLHFTDPPNKENYYYLVVLYNDYKLDIYNFAGRNVFNSNDPVFIKHVDRKQYYIFDDELFDGETYNLDIQVTTNTDTYNDTIQYYFYLCSMNYDYYKYLESYNKYVLTTSDNNPLPLTEPINFYNNIENGLGIFGGYQTSVDSFLYIP